MPSLFRPSRPALMLCLLPIGMGIARAVPVTLRVTDGADKPVAGATVQYLEISAKDLDDAEENIVPVTPTAQAATSGADGTVTLDLPEVVLSEKAKKRLQVFAALSKKTEDYTQVLGRARVRAPGLASADISLRAGDNVLKLEPSAQMSGQISDDKGGPLAGAFVKLLRVADKTDGEPDYLYFDTTGFDPLSATTGADGRWVLDELPPRGIAALQAGAPGRASANFRAWLEGAQNPAPVQKLEPGGTVSGRLLSQKGEPIVGAQIYRSNAFDGLNRSDKDGRFRLEGVPIGAQQLQIYGSANWFGSDEQISATVAQGGQNVDLGDLTSGAGTVISGVVLSKNGRKPLVGLEVQLENKKVKTDDKGRFEGRISGNYLQLQIVGDYTTSGDNFRQIPTKSATYDAGEILAERGVALPLDVRDEKGEVVIETSLSFSGKGSQEYAQFDGEKLTTGPLAEGEYQLQGYGSWQVIEPKTAKVPAFVEGKKPETLAIKMRRLPQQKVAGRVVNAKGEPLPNLVIPIKLSGDEYRFQELSALSRRDGSWEVEFSPANPDDRNQNAPVEPSVSDIKSASYARVRGGEVKRQNEIWRAADIVMARADATLQGRVVGADGVPVNNASLSWTGAKTGDFARTDAEGKFVLSNLPDAPVQLRVSDGPRLLETRELMPGEAAEIALPGADKILDPAQIEILWQVASDDGISGLDSYYEALGAPRLLEAALRADEANAEVDKAVGNNLDAYLQMSVRHQPATAVAQGVELLKDKDLKSADGMGVAALALAAARSKDQGARAFATRWFDARIAGFSTQQEGDAGILPALQLAGVGTRLGRDEAASYRDLALLWGDRVKDDSRLYALDNWGELLWQGGPKFYDEAVAEWSALDRLLALSGALKSIDNTEQGRALLARLEALAKDPAVAKADAERAAKQQYSEPMRDRALQAGHANFARALATSDPAAALDEIEKTTEGYRVQDIAIQIASDAIAANKPELARRALAIGLKDNYTNRPGTSAMAMLARGFDAKLADELLADTRSAVLPGEDNRFGGRDDYQSVSNYAVALRAVEPGAGRLLLEQEWARRDAQKPDENDRWQRDNARRELARAMAVYDVERALDWAEKAGTKNNGGTNLRASIIAAALAAPDKRAFMLVSDYGG